jgi:hypothetical protein
MHNVLLPLCLFSVSTVRPPAVRSRAISLSSDGTTELKRHLRANAFSRLYGSAASTSCHRSTIESNQLVDLQMLGLHELSLESDGHLLTNEYAASFQGSVPGQTEILPIDLCCR